MKRLSVASAGVVAVMLAAAATAWACTNLATLNLSRSAVTPGESIEVTGSSFRTAERGGQDVFMRWNGLDGEVLAQMTPDASGQVVATVSVPGDALPGYYTMVATQDVAGQDGDVAAGGASPAFGTPARASLQVGQPAVAPDAAVANPPVASDAVSPTLLLLTAVLAVAGLGLFAGGFGLFLREARSNKVPQVARSRQD